MSPRANPRQLIQQLLLSTEDGAILARDIVAACAVFGIRDNSARVALVRLSAAGMVEATARGEYRAGPQAAGLSEEVRAWRQAESRVGPWSGHWVAVHGAAVVRSDRAALRRRDRALRLLGFRELDRDFFVRPDNLVAGVVGVRARLAKLGLDSETSAVFLATDLDEEREARARRLWARDTLSSSYVNMRESLEDWLAKSASIDVVVAARESIVLGHEAIRMLVFDPLLPAELVDVEARRAFVATLLRYDAAGHAIWRKLAASVQREDDPSLTAPLSH